jgi:hypothetical protein
MNTMLKLVVSVTLLLAAGTSAVPASANEVAVVDDVSSAYPAGPDFDIFRVQCTQPANHMCVALMNEDPDGKLLASAVVSSPSNLVGQAWAERMQPNAFRVHCFASGRAQLITAYVAAAAGPNGPIPYQLLAQCWIDNWYGGYTTRGTTITKTQDD